MNRHKRTTAYRRLMVGAAAMLAVVSLLLAGCESSRTAREEGSVPVYYLNKERTAIVGASYIPDASLLQENHAEELVEDLLLRLQIPEDAAEEIAPIQESSVMDWSLEDGILTLNMEADYRKLGRTEEILVRAALVNTLCGVNGVDAVAMTIEGEPIKNKDGSTVGVQSGSDFIFSADRELRAYEQIQLHLYFADESGTSLISTYRTVVYNSNIPQEHLVVEEVLKGPNTDVVYPTLNPDTRILSVTTRDEICYVNLDRSFLTDPYNVSSRVAIYSLVNSLTELPSVSSVQIRIEGEAQENFMDISLRNEFSRDLSLVANS